MKDPSWQKVADYGWKTDYICASTETLYKMLDDMRRPREYWAQPKKGKWDRGQAKRFAAQAAAPLLILDEAFEKWNEVFHLAQAELGHPRVRNHSLGMFAITMATERLKPQTIRLVGFDNMLNPGLKEYWKADRGKWQTQHDWPAERLMLPVIEQTMNVKIEAWA